MQEVDSMGFADPKIGFVLDFLGDARGHSFLWRTNGLGKHSMANEETVFPYRYLEDPCGRGGLGGLGGGDVSLAVC
jgi:hypothetical protein